jgi:uncharacterized protein
MKFRTQLAGFLLLSVVVVVQAQVQPLSELKPSNYVNDYAGVLDTRTVSELDDLCRQADQKTGTQIAVVTVSSIGDSSIETYANKLFKKWGIGDRETNKGILILLAVHNHRYRFEVGNGLRSILPNARVGAIGNDAVPLLRKNDYDGAVSLMVSSVTNIVADDAGVVITHIAPTPTQYQQSREVQQEPDRGKITAIAVLGFFGAGIVVYLILRLGFGTTRLEPSTNVERNPNNDSGGFWNNPSSNPVGFWNSSSSTSETFSDSSSASTDTSSSSSDFGGFDGGDSSGGGTSGSW